MRWEWDAPSALLGLCLAKCIQFGWSLALHWDVCWGSMQSAEEGHSAVWLRARDSSCGGVRLLHCAHILGRRCGHCKSLAPAFTKAAEKLKHIVPFVAVDCDAEKNRPLCGAPRCAVHAELGAASPPLL